MVPIALVSHDPGQVGPGSLQTTHQVGLGRQGASSHNDKVNEGKNGQAAHGVVEGGGEHEKDF